ncbi:hypothetical protein MMC32_006111 [Xylographa parallela]|nr:hypothetical protein [Xylographa parallela]
MLDGSDYHHPRVDTSRLAVANQGTYSSSTLMSAGQILMPAADNTPDLEILSDHKNHLFVPCHATWDPKSSPDTWQWPEWMHSAYIQGDPELIQTTEHGPTMIQVPSARKDLVENLLQESSRTDEDCESKPNNGKKTTDRDDEVAGLSTAVATRLAKTEVDCSRKETEKAHIRQVKENDRELIEDLETWSRVAYIPTRCGDLWTLMSRP